MVVSLLSRPAPRYTTMMEEIPQISRKISKSFRQKLGDIFDLESSGRVILCSALVGVVAGLGAASFFAALNYVEYHVLGGVVGYIQPDAGTEISGHEAVMPPAMNWWLVLLIPTIGGLLCGIIVYGLAPEAEGHGTDGMVGSFHRLRGEIRARVPLVKAVASILTIGSGGSAGREGPIAQIGSGFGSVLASKLGMSDSQRRQLLLAGAAGGIGAIFRAPLGGALFVVEVLYASTAIEFTAIVPCVISSVVAYTVFVSFFGTSSAFTIEHITFHGFKELPSYLVFAVLCALVGFIYVSVFYGLRNRFFRRIPLPNAFKPALGGLLLGLIALELPHVMSGGYGWIQQAIDGNLLVETMLLLALAKIVATSLTISSGGSGGVFAPSLFIGAMLGGAYGFYVHQLYPELVPQPEAYILVGMGGFFAGVAKVPLTALIMVSEMCGSYDLLAPLMLVSIVNVAVLSSRWTLYEEQVSSLIDSPAHLGDFVVDVLARIQVRSVYRVDHPIDLIPQETPLPIIIKLVASSQNNYFPVVDDDQHLVGIFSLHDVRSILEGDRAGGLILAADIATFPVLTVTPNDDLHTALRRFTRKNIDELPIVNPDDPLRVIGMLRRKEVIGAYDEQLAAMRHDQKT